MANPQAVDNLADGIDLTSGEYRLRRRQSAMGSVFEIILDGDRDEVELRALIESAFAEVVEPLEMQLSHYRSGSEISWINENANRGPVRVEPRLFDLLMECADLTSMTQGAFDVTIGPLVRCWGFHRKEGRVPSTEELAEVRERVGMEHVVLDAQAGAVAFDREGIELNLGGIGKGYVVDRVVEYLTRYGAHCALVASGGSTVYAMGVPPISENGWHVGVRPAGAEGERIGSLHLTDAALSTSGDFRQHFVEGGVRYGHIIDPRTGWPARGVRAACSVTASGTRADALSTAFVVLGTEDTESFCSKYGERALLMSLNAENEPETRQFGQPILEQARSMGGIS